MAAMSARTQSRKKTPIEPVLDDWDTSEPESEPASSAGPSPSSSSIKQGERQNTAEVNDMWGSGGRGIGGTDFRAPVQGKKLWEEANQSRPAAQPVFNSTRVLPQSVLAPSLSSSSASSSSSSSGTMGNATSPSIAAAPPPPRILQRERLSEAEEAARRAALQQGQAERKTLQQREEEYRKARERIFGTTADSGTKSNGSSGNVNGSERAQQRNSKSRSVTPSEQRATSTATSSR